MDPLITEKECIPKSCPHPENEPVKLNLRGSGSFPTMVRARTANRNKIQKRNSESNVITGGMGPSAQNSYERNISNTKKRRFLKKKSVYSRVTRRKSLENLGLVVRNRCGTAKLQWPSEKRESDVFDLLPEGCMQVRSLQMKSLKHAPDDENMFQLKGGSEEDKDKQEDIPPNHNLPCQGHRLSTSLCSITSPGVLLGGNKTDWKNRRNISVIVRIRPKQSREMKEKSIVFRTDSKTVLFDPKEKTKDFYFQGVKQSTRNDFGRKRPNRNVTFQYDKVYGPEATNRQIFGEMLRDLTDHLIEGYNSTVFAYGATGSGKTYTMIGSNNNPGLTVLMVESLYGRIEELSLDYECDVLCSYLEVYNETIKDLLRPEKELSIREDGKKGIIIPELTFYKPRGPSELLKLLRNGNRARTQHATDLNAESSRSHAVFEVKLCLKKKRNNLSDDGDNNDNEDMEDGLNKVEVIHSKLVMVDLAGSERGTAALASSIVAGGTNQGGIFMQGGGIGARQREGASINKSLLALANCISALADGKCHIPYRNSKLTRLLKDALSGNCTTVMIANISPSALTSEDTYNTLKYADRAKSIVGPGIKQKNVFLEDLIIEDCVKTQVAELQSKLEQLSEMLEEEKLKNELMMKEQSRLKEENEHMTLEKKSRDGFWDNKNEKKIVRRKLGGGDADDGPPHVREEETSRQLLQDGIEGLCCWNTNGENGSIQKTPELEEKLPKEIQKYVKIAGERARIYGEYVEFASKHRLQEWASTCKKLKCDMGDFLGRLPVSDKNYVTFCKLKNEVNAIQKPEGGGLTPFHNETENHIVNQEHRKFAIKLKNLTEKLELARTQVILNSRTNSSTKLQISGGKSRGTASTGEEKCVSISTEEFLLFRRLLAEQEGNDKMERFYQQFCQQINSQLITSGRTLSQALLLVKNLYVRLQQTNNLTPKLDEEYKKLADSVYGTPPPLPPQTATVHFDTVPEHFFHPNHLHNNKVANDNFRSISDTSLLSLPVQAPPPPTRLTSVPVVPLPLKPQLKHLGRRSPPVLDDLSNMKNLVEKPLLIQLTSLLGEEDEEADEEEDERENTEPDFTESTGHEEKAEEGSETKLENENGSSVRKTSRISKPETSSLTFLLTPRTSRSSTSDKTYNKSNASPYSGNNDEDEDEANSEDDFEDEEENSNNNNNNNNDYTSATSNSSDNENGSSAGTETFSD